MSCYIVQEIDGTSRFTLEDGSGSLLLEFCAPVVGTSKADGGRLEAEFWRRRRLEELAEEESIISVLMGEL